ncbi:MAG TPA: tetratricopeptide repeat protein [Bryobacteraceae bacterium]|jgi:tetratricopeptide (TPR) repeat protein|nr:tetratricopeptide repeat protein [Bryobacteraceae bacterium]
MSWRRRNATCVACTVLLLACAFSLAAQTIERAEALWKAHDYDGANAAFKALVAAQPKNALARVRWGNLFYERFNAAEAGKLYEEALGIDPKNAPALLGEAQILADNYDPKANDLANKALESDPKLYQAHELMAKTALEDDNPKKADSEADAALAIQSDALEAIAVKASIDLLADKQSPWVAKIGNRGKGYETIAHFYMINRRYEDTIQYLHKAIAATPDLWSAHSELGINLMRLGREGEARQELQAAYDNHFRDSVTANALTLMDSYNKFVTTETPTTALRLNKKEADALRPYFQEEMQRAMATYEKKYKFKLNKPVQVEVYPDHEDFAVRTQGLPGLGALGVTFDNYIAMDSPSGRPPGEFHWASTLWHEMSHVYVIAMTNDRVPRWFTEGLAVHEETAASPDWGDRVSPEILAAIRDKKLLPIAEIDRGFVHPTYPAQVIVSYYEAGKICDFIVQKWGDQKILDMIHEFAKNRPTVDVIKEQLGMEPEAFDKEFLAMIDKETGKAVAGFADWTKQVREISQLAKEGKNDEVIAKGRAIEGNYPDYVEAGNVYNFVAEACLTKGDKACAMDEWGRYSKIGGRDPETMKKYAKLLQDAGKLKEAEAALERMNFIYPIDPELHERLGNMLMQTGDAKGAVREFQVLVALHPIDAAGSHYNLAKAFQAAGQKDQAREEAVNALEAAPNYKPAQKLLLEVSGDEK